MYTKKMFQFQGQLNSLLHERPRRKCHAIWLVQDTRVVVDQQRRIFGVFVCAHSASEWYFSRSNAALHHAATYKFATQSVVVTLLSRHFDAFRLNFYQKRLLYFGGIRQKPWVGQPFRPPARSTQFFLGERAESTVSLPKPSKWCVVFLSQRESEKLSHVEKTCFAMYSVVIMTLETPFSIGQQNSRAWPGPYCVAHLSHAYRAS